MPLPITCVVSKNAEVSMIYSDKIDLSHIGVIKSVKRWSTIEFNQDMKLWEVCLDGKTDVLFRDRSRAACLAFEHEHFNKVAKGV